MVFYHAPTTPLTSHFQEFYSPPTAGYGFRVVEKTVGYFSSLVNLKRFIIKRSFGKSELFSYCSKHMSKTIQQEETGVCANFYFSTKYNLVVFCPLYTVISCLGPVVFLLLICEIQYI